MSGTGASLSLATIIAAVLTPSTAVVAQGPVTHRAGLWATAAFGPTRPYEWAAVGTAALRYTRIVLRGRYTITFEVPGARVDDLGVLLGVVVTPPSRRSQIVLGAGVGRVRQVYDCLLCPGPVFAPTAGLLLDAEGRWALAPGLGFTGRLFGDLNSRLSFGGLALGLFLGTL